MLADVAGGDFGNGLVCVFLSFFFAVVLVVLITLWALISLFREWFGNEDPNQKDRRKDR